MPAPSSEPEVGNTFALLPSDADDTSDHVLCFRVVAQHVQPEPSADPVVPDPVVVAPTVPDDDADVAAVPDDADAPTLPLIPTTPIGPTVPVTPVDPIAPTPTIVPLVPVMLAASADVAAGVEIVVETSVDREQWFEATAPIGLEALPLMTGDLELGPYVRARTTGDAQHQVEIHLMATGAYQLEIA